jgi:Ser/Thr protein kinase RdoA (MazF antagonist)
VGVEAVTARFGVTPTRVRRLGRGAVNDLWVVDAGDQRYVLKRTHVERLPQHTEREHLVLRHLLDQGWSVPSPVAADDGATHVRIDGRTWWLAPWLPGRQPVTTSHSVARLGSLLARLHVALAPLASLPPVDTVTPRTILTREVPRHGWRFADALPELERADHARGARLRREVERVTTELDGFAPGPTVLGHGDLHVGNLVVHRGSTSVLDFDFCGPQERAVDVATAVCLLDDQRLAPALVVGERAAVPLLFDARLLLHASWVTFMWSRGETTPAELDTTFDRLGTCGIAP